MEPLGAKSPTTWHRQRADLSAEAVADPSAAKPSGSELRPREKQILDVAAESFAHIGFEETSLQKIADAVGMRKPSLYHYFSCKEDILWALLEAGLNSQFEAATAVWDSWSEHDTPSVKMRKLLDAHAVHLDERMDHVRIFLRSYEALGPERTERYVSLRNKYVQLFVDLVAEGQETGEFPRGDPKIVAYGILGMYNWMLEWYRKDDSYTTWEIHQIWMDTVLVGMTAVPKRKR
jgi:TetR/AcrR family transcriptional regulator, cholesterol catabolism regulator